MHKEKCSFLSPRKEKKKNKKKIIDQRHWGQLINLYQLIIAYVPFHEHQFHEGSGFQLFIIDQNWVLCLDIFFWYYIFHILYFIGVCIIIYIYIYISISLFQSMNTQLITNLCETSRAWPARRIEAWSTLAIPSSSAICKLKWSGQLSDYRSIFQSSYLLQFAGSDDRYAWQYG